MKHNKSAAILVAAGQGERLSKFTDGIPKQFSELGGMPLFIWSLATFAGHPKIEQVVLCVPEGWGKKTFDWIGQHLPEFAPNVTILTGGSTRQESVWLALESLADHPPSYVIIHDAVRPFVTTKIIDQVIDKLKQGHSITLAIPASDSITRVDAETIIDSLDRSKLALVQTPQATEFNTLLKAHQNARLKKQIVTDDASIIKSHGVEVITIPGSRLNLKITEPEDLAIAQALIKYYNWCPGKVETYKLSDPMTYCTS